MTTKNSDAFSYIIKPVYFGYPTFPRLMCSKMEKRVLVLFINDIQYCPKPLVLSKRLLH